MSLPEVPGIPWYWRCCWCCLKRKLSSRPQLPSDTIVPSFDGTQQLLSPVAASHIPLPTGTVFPDDVANSEEWVKGGQELCSDAVDVI